MRKLNDSLETELRKYAEKIQDARQQCQEADRMYKPEVAVTTCQKIVVGVAKELSLARNVINNEVDKELKNIKETKSNQYASKDNQLMINNMLKMLELSDFNIGSEQFKEMIQPLVDNADFPTLKALETIMKNKGKIELEMCCKDTTINSDMAAMEKMLTAIKQYVNTNILISIGGEITEYKYSSYEEIILLAKSLDFDTETMNKKYGGTEKIVNENSFIDRQASIAMGVKVDAPVFKNISGINENEEIKKAIGII